jgi:hypothetical protein
MEELLVRLFGWSRTTYFSWKKEGRPILSLVHKYLDEDSIQEFLDTGKISKFELLGNSKDEIENINELLLDNAIYSAKAKLISLFETSLVDFLNTYYSKDILQNILKDMAEDQDQDLNASNVKDKLMDRIKGFEASFVKRPTKELLSKIIYRNFSKIEIYAMLTYTEEVFNYVGYFGKSK